MKLEPALVPTPESDLFDVLEEAFRIVTENMPIMNLLREKGYTTVGGYLCITDEGGTPILITRVGEGNPEKNNARLEFCQEKARRLAAHPEHMLSSQSRDKERQMYGGAVRGTIKKLIVSFSGLPERVDELYAQTILFLLSDTSLNGAEWLGDQGNPYAGTYVRFDRDFKNWLIAP
jgi:hypothetical protein